MRSAKASIRPNRSPVTTCSTNAQTRGLIHNLRQILAGKSPEIAIDLDIDLKFLTEFGLFFKQAVVRVKRHIFNFEYVVCHVA